MTKIGLTLILTLFVAISGSAQNKQTKKTTQSKGTDLQKEIKATNEKVDNLKKEIDAATKELQKNSQKKKKTLSEVNLMNDNIKKREELIKTYSEQMNLLNRKISQGTENINNMNKELNRLTEEYAKMVQFAYRYRNRYDQLEFLFASKDFNQAMQRMRYIQQFADARKTKIEQITNVRQQVNEEVEANRKAMEEQKALLAEQQAQQDILKKEKAELDAQVTALKKEEDKLVADIKKKQKEREKLQNQLMDLIRRDEEAKKAAEEAAKSGTKKTGSSTKTTQTNTIPFTPEEKQISSKFGENKGKLVWPVEQGRISSKYGDNPSPISPKISIHNNGIDIKTTENAKARAVFDGVVALVSQEPPSNQCIIIRHGDYYTAYSELDAIYVKSGDKVKTKQAIGKVHTNRTEGETLLHFELTKGKAYQNPELWLTRAK